MAKGQKVERTKYDRDAHDFYSESAWASAALFRVEPFRGEIWDPAVGNGNIVASARRAGHIAWGSDIADRPWAAGGYERIDFCDRLTSARFADNIISNPPFNLCSHIKTLPYGESFAFIKQALHVARYKVAMFLPSDYLTGIRRARYLKTTPLYKVHFLSPRPEIRPGGLELGKFNGMTDFAWFIWNREHSGPWTGHFLEREPIDEYARADQPGVTAELGGGTWAAGGHPSPE